MFRPLFWTQTGYTYKGKNFAIGFLVGFATGRVLKYFDTACGV